MAARNLFDQDVYLTDGFPEPAAASSQASGRNIEPGRAALLKPRGMRTRLSICARKARYPSIEAALAAARQSGLALRHYRCDRCFQFHLTSRTKGKRIARPN